MNTRKRTKKKERKFVRNGTLLNDILSFLSQSLDIGRSVRSPCTSMISETKDLSFGALFVCVAALLLIKKRGKFNMFATIAPHSARLWFSFFFLKWKLYPIQNGFKMTVQLLLSHHSNSVYFGCAFHWFLSETLWIWWKKNSLLKLLKVLLNNRKKVENTTTWVAYIRAFFWK